MLLRIACSTCKANDGYDQHMSRKALGVAAPVRLVAITSSTGSTLEFMCRDMLKDASQ